MKKLFLVIILFSIIITGCSSGAQNQATETLSPTSTLTLTPNPTSTPLPTQTPTSTPTPTLMPTPTGSGMGKLAYIKETKLENSEFSVTNVYIYDFATQTEIQVTNNKKDSIGFFYQNINWSPDGTHLLFSAHTHTYNYGQREIWNSMIFTMNSDGSNVQKVTMYPQLVGNYQGKYIVDDNRPSFITSDQILFLSNRKNLQNFLWEPLKPYIVNTTTMEITSPFTTYLKVEYLSMSPDQTKIVLMADDGDSEIYISDLSDNGKVTQITKNTFSDRFPTYSPDGEWIAFHSDRDGNIELYVMRSDGSEVTRVTSNAAEDGTASWSPDGKWLAFYSDQTGTAEAFIQNINTGERIQITNGGDPVSYVRWSP